MPGKTAIDNARAVLRMCSTRHGMYASGGKGGYNMVFARDAMIGLIGASCLDSKKEFKAQFGKTIETLARHQSAAGQIPNAVDKWDSKRTKKVHYATIDSTLWWLLGLKAYAKYYGNRKILKANKERIARAFNWLSCQDTGEDSLPEQLPTSDWQDCFPHKYGHTINTAALYYECLKQYGKSRQAMLVRRTATGHKSEFGMFCGSKGYFYPWRWKGHDGIVELEDWFDSLGNVLAVCSGYANAGQAASILDFIEGKNVAKPYPIRAIHPPIKKGGKEWHPYFSKCLAAKPNYYLNGGIWPFIGGFYVSALVKAKRFEQAEKQLALLEGANRLGVSKQWEFNEWIHPIKKRAMGSPYHAWSAGSYMLALKSVSKRKAAFFL